jgi:serine/threonine-protein kinase
MAPDSIGRYNLIGEIGRGGMATVYRAHDPRFKRDVAIKLMTRDLLQDPTLKARFEREAQTIASLEHPAIVPVYDFGEEDDRPYLVMRLMNANTLDHRLKQGHLSIAETSAILDRIGSALERAHERGVVHRDLKPSNIMFDDYGDAFLADFGIARLTESAVTLTGDSVIGTPAYMSPEQIHGDKAIDGRSDIYALGVICFEMLTGERPYTDTTPAKVMMRHIMDPVPDIRKVKPDLPQGVESLIAHTMAKDPDERYQTPHEMTDTLSAISKVGEITTPPVASSQQADKEAPPATEPAVPEDETIVPAAVVAALATTQEEPEETVIEVPAAPRVDDETEFPETEVVVPSFVGEEIPQTEIAVPSFVGQEPDSRVEPGAVEDERGQNWLLFGLGAIVVIVVIGAVIGGGIFLFSQFSGDDEEGQAAVVTTSEVDEQPTSRPAATAVAPVELPGDVPVDELDEETRFVQAEEHLASFYQALEQENWDGAMAAIEQAISLVPEDPRFIHEQAFLLYTLDELDPALERINQAIEIEPDEGSFFETRSLILWKMGDIDAALDNGLRAIELDGATDATYANLGDIYLEFGNYESALESFDNAIRMNPSNAEHYSGRAHVLEEIGEYEAASEDLTVAIELDPDAIWFLDQLGGIVLWGLGDTRRAVEIYSELVEQEPDNAWHFLNRGIAKRELGDIEGSLADLNTAIELEPEETWFNTELAWTHYAAGNVDEAIATFTRAIEIDPGDPESYYQRANFFYYDLEDLGAALEDYNRAIELDPEGGWRYLERAFVFLDMGDVDSALADLETGISFEPEDIGLYLEKGNLFADLGDIDAALHEFDRAIEVDPFDPSGLEHKAVLLWDIGDYDAALATFERCLEVDPRFPWCHYNMGWLYDDLGDIGAAVERFRSFIEYVNPLDCPDCNVEVQEYIDINS